MKISLQGMNYSILYGRPYFCLYAVKVSAIAILKMGSHECEVNSKITVSSLLPLHVELIG